MSERLTDAAIREAMQSDGLPPESGGTILRLAVEALARGEERDEARGAYTLNLITLKNARVEAEALRAEVARLTRAALRTSAECPSCGDDISFPSARATIEDAPADAIEDGAESFCRECNVRARWTCDAETAGSVVLDYDEDRKEYEATVEAAGRRERHRHCEGQRGFDPRRGVR